MAGHGASGPVLLQVLRLKNFDHQAGRGRLDQLRCQLMPTAVCLFLDMRPRLGEQLLLRAPTVDPLNSPSEAALTSCEHSRGPVTRGNLEAVGPGDRSDLTAPRDGRLFIPAGVGVPMSR